MGRGGQPRPVMRYYGGTPADCSPQGDEVHRAPTALCCGGPLLCQPGGGVMPYRIKARCTKCNAMAVERGRCEEHKRVAWEDRSANARALSGRQRATFKARVMRNADGKCEMCGAPATEADHIMEISDGGDPFDAEGNGQALCGMHHDLKTIEARRARNARRALERARERG